MKARICTLLELMQVFALGVIFGAGVEAESPGTFIGGLLIAVAGLAAIGWLFRSAQAGSEKPFEFVPASETIMEIKKKLSEHPIRGDGESGGKTRNQQ